MNPSKGILIGLALVVACGGQKPASSDPGAKTDTPRATASTSAEDSGPLDPGVGALRLGHYSTGNGLTGLVLDRSGARPKMQLDGDADVIELTPRAGWKQGITYLKDPKGNIRLELDDRGGVLLIGQGRPQRLHWDGAADKLGAATVAGEAPPEEVSPADQHREALTRISVIEQLPGFRSEDAGDLAKVRKALAQAKPQMLVHTGRAVDRDVFRPSPRKIGDTDHGGAGGYWPSNAQWSRDAEGLLAHGGVPVGRHARDGGNWIRIHRPEGYPAPLAANTPGVVWEVDSTTIWFVAFDGGRYRLEWEDVAKGLPTGAWAPALQHTLLKNDDVDFLARTGAMAKAKHQALEAINKAFNRCTKDGWEGFDKKIDALAKKNLSWSTRAQRAEVMEKERAETVEKACRKHVDAMDDALVSLIEARNAERSALFAAAKKRHG